MSQEVPEELKIIFEEYDKDNSGELGPEELRQLLEDLDFGKSLRATRPCNALSHDCRELAYL